MTKEEIKQMLKKSGKYKLDNAARAKEKDSFIDLPSGNVHYQLAGEGEPCVLVPGYATPYYLFDKIFDRLVAEGYKVLRYDLFGRGLSERVNEAYSPEFFARQANEIIEHFFPGEKINLFGTSMGGAVTASFCALYPGKVKKIVWLAPAGMDSFQPPFYMKLCSLPVIGDALFQLIGSKILLNSCAKELTHCPVEERDYYTREFGVSIKYKGFPKCTLSSLRNTILRTDKVTANYIKTAAQKIPTLIIWGTVDQTMPYYQIDRMKEVYPDAEFVTFENSGHTFLFDEGEKTMEYVMPFMKK